MTLEYESVGRCILCSTNGSTLYSRVTDHLYGIPGEFAEQICPRCGLIWLSPRPTQAQMGAYYTGYYTHVPRAAGPSFDGNRRLLGTLRDKIRGAILCGHFGYRQLHPTHTWCRLGNVLGRARWLRLRATNEWKDLLPRHRPGGSLLDIGPGRGDFLVDMQALGWSVQGVELDADACSLARSRGLSVQCGSIEAADIADDSIDHVTMHHVLEHLRDPASALRKCVRVLRPGGTVVIYVPNSDSLGHHVFREYWLALDPPRHLFTFSSRHIAHLLRAAGFAEVSIYTSARFAGGTYDTSRMLVTGVATKGIAPATQPGCKWFGARERIFCMLGMPRGEEIVARAVKPRIGRGGT
jgi:2-polyprenyl-3-methyl-5-hydroxy-6-metoxy-1,4-benzoquinol methylase